MSVSPRKTANPIHVARIRATPVTQAAATAAPTVTRPASVYSGMRRPPSDFEQEDREHREKREQQRLLKRDPGRHDRHDPGLARREPAARGAQDVEREEDDQDGDNRPQQPRADDAG